jgi:hypothetical protein
MASRLQSRYVHCLSFVIFVGLTPGSAVHGITASQARALCGVREGGPVLLKKTFAAHEMQALPSQFNSITNWVWVVV